MLVFFLKRFHDDDENIVFDGLVDVFPLLETANDDYFQEGM